MKLDFFTLFIYTAQTLEHIYTEAGRPIDGEKNSLSVFQISMDMTGNKNSYHFVNIVVKICENLFKKSSISYFWLVD